MDKHSLIKTWTDLLFIGPAISWRVFRMTLASAQVISRRSRILLVGPWDNQRRREIKGMVQEKFFGACEAMHAATSGLIRENTAFVIKSISSLTNLAGLHSKRSSPLRLGNAINLSIAMMMSVAVPLGLILSVSRIFLDATEPLHKRVTKNAKRLRKKTSS